MKLSLDNQYILPSPKCSIVFTEHIPGHDDLKKAVVGSDKVEAEDDENTYG